MLDNLDLRNRQADAEHIVSYLSTDALESPYNFALSSCNHMVHYNCFSRMMQREGATLHKNCSDFLCPVCRRLGSSVFPLFFPVKVDCQWRERLGDALLFRPDAVDDRSFNAVYAEEKETMDHYLLVVVGRRAEG